MAQGPLTADDRTTAPATLADLVATSRTVAGTPGRLDKIAALADLLRRTPPDQVPIAIGLLIGEPRQGRLGVGWATVGRSETPSAATPSLTLEDVDRAFTELAALDGAGSQVARADRLRALLVLATEPERDHLIRVLGGEVRQGANAGVVADAVAKAAGRPAAELRRAAMLLGDLGTAASLALAGGDLSGIGLTTMVGVQPMLAGTAPSVAAALTVTGPASVEWKLDGARIQVHRRGDRVRVFTRTLNEIAARVPEVVGAVRALPADDLVLDGEALGLDPDGNPLKFQDSMSSGAQLRPFFFDLLAVGGQSLIDEPLSARKSALAATVPTSLRLPTLDIADPTDATDAERFAGAALDAGHEGVMIKAAGLDLSGRTARRDVAQGQTGAHPRPGGAGRRVGTRAPVRLPVQHPPRGQGARWFVRHGGQDLQGHDRCVAALADRDVPGHVAGHGRLRRAPPAGDRRGDRAGRRPAVAALPGRGGPAVRQGPSLPTGQDRRPGRHHRAGAGHALRLGRYRAAVAAVGLVFGVGWAHESLYRRGITEMAFGWLFDGLAMDVSWAINATTTSVYAAGEPRDLQHLLDAMSARLASGPAGVATHKIAAGGETDGVLLRNRWGYRSYGLAAATRYGYATCAPADVRAWLAHIGQETTAQFSAEFDPEPLQLPSVTPLPEPDRTQVATSGFIPIGKGFGLSWLQDRNPTVELAGQIVLSSIERSIPGPGPGRSGVEGVTRPVGADVRHVGLVAVDPDINPDRLAAVFGELERLRSQGPDEMEIVAAMDHLARHPRSPFDEAVTAANDRLWSRAGYRMPREAELAADTESLRAQIWAVCATLQVLCPAPPPGAFLPTAGGTDRPDPATGRTFAGGRVARQEGMSAKQRMVVGDHRLTHFAPDPRTVTAASVAVVERRPDGERVLLDQSGMVLVVDPLVWSQGKHLVTWVDENLPRQVDRTERLPADPFIAKAAAKVKPLVVIVGAVVVGILGLFLLLGGLTAHRDRAFPIVFGVLF